MANWPRNDNTLWVTSTPCSGNSSFCASLLHSALDRLLARKTSSKRLRRSGLLVLNESSSM